jgi:hypothetical protein
VCGLWFFFVFWDTQSSIPSFDYINSECPWKTAFFSFDFFLSHVSLFLLVAMM